MRLLPSGFGLSGPVVLCGSPFLLPGQELCQFGALYPLFRRVERFPFLIRGLLAYPLVLLQWLRHKSPCADRARQKDGRHICVHLPRISLLSMLMLPSCFRRCVRGSSRMSQNNFDRRWTRSVNRYQHPPEWTPRCPFNGREPVHPVRRTQTTPTIEYFHLTQPARSLVQSKLKRHLTRRETRFVGIHPRQN